jgi:alpha/beta superfamily hydrolase
VDDVRAALNWLAREFHLPIIFVGFSFGAVVGAKAACPDPRVVAVISIGTPFRVSEEESAQAGGPAQARSYPHQALRQCTKPKLLISGAADPFAPREDLERLAAELPEPEELVLIEGAGHFFEGKLEELREAIQRWVRERVLSGS